MFGKKNNQQDENISSLVNYSQDKVLIEEKEKNLTKKFDLLSISKQAPTFLAGDISINGNIKSAGVVEIDGEFDGIIEAQKIIIRSNGRVKGSINGSFIVIKGNFSGNICASNLHLMRSCQVFAEITYDNLAVEDGAIIDGNFKKLK
jgi:cytoskeletal protein CcmA (bactofilin family)